jgi:hypothetical protein
VSELDALVDRFLAHHVRFHPVDASFMGLAGGDDRLPPVDDEAPEREAAELGALLAALEELRVSPTERLEARMLRAALIHAKAALEHWPRFAQPSWATGEIAFGIVSLLLPSAPACAGEALARRLAAIPVFLAGATRLLAGRSVFVDGVERARRESRATCRLLQQGLPHHRLWNEKFNAPVADAVQALRAFETSFDALQPGKESCGSDYLALLMREVHGLNWSPEEAIAIAEDGFRRLSDAMSLAARKIDASASPESILAGLAERGPAPDRVVATYDAWHDHALDASRDLVTAASDYHLSFRHHAPWARCVLGELYFLAYRSPPATGARRGSVYWVPPPGSDETAYRRTQNLVTIKQTHAVHHGSIGHHTQNARARVAPSRLARIAGTDCAAGIAFLSAGTMVEGWACYATELMDEVEGFYTPQERLALLHGDRRNAASVLADIKLHSGVWSLEEMRAFYRDEAGFPAARVGSETTRNAIFPATRLMYFLGSEQIKALRREIKAPTTRDFHDALLACGHVPIAWAADELRARFSGPAA